MMIKNLFLGLTPWVLILVMLFSCRENSGDRRGLERDQLEAAFTQYKEASITHRRFKHKDILPLIQERTDDFKVVELGKSVQGREILQLTYGNGPIKVLLWSQMHGNESTATMALMDLFNFLEGSQDDFDSVRNILHDKLEIRFIPMVNPDGAEVFQRRNAWDIDLNRDAIRGITPEASLLKTARESFDPVFGFNLHDQQIYYNPKGESNPAAISVLAPAFNEERGMNEVRENAIKIIVGMNRVLQQVVPGHVGKYDDTFEPRAFGDNFQKWGTSTILIESGGYPDDPEKQFIRQLNFMIILNALYEIAANAYVEYPTEEYYAIPDNDSKLMDLLIKNVTIEQGGNTYQVDMGVRRSEVGADSSWYVSGTIVDVGDLTVNFGYEEFNADGLTFKKGNIWKGAYPSIDAITEERAFELLTQGYMGVRIANPDGEDFYTLPLIAVENEQSFKSGHQLGNAANFFLEKDGKSLYAIINGYLIDLQGPITWEWRQKIR